MNTNKIAKIVSQALREDIQPRDITTNALVSPRQVSQAKIILKEDAVLCGVSIAKSVFRKLDPNIIFKSKYKDGASIKKGSVISTLKGKTRALLSGERVALNFLGYLSGIATHTNNYKKAVKPFKAKILDTRKTTPTLRFLEKYAVTCGGGQNHRMTLSDMVMIKDNHREVCLPMISIQESIHIVRNKTNKKIIVEVDNLKQFHEALEAKPDIILLDNMNNSDMQKAVHLRNAANKKILLEASGGVNIKSVHKIAKTGVDRISVGSLTHSHSAIDISMEII